MVRPRSPRRFVSLDRDRRSFVLFVDLDFFVSRLVDYRLRLQEIDNGVQYTGSL